MNQDWAVWQSILTEKKLAEEFYGVKINAELTFVNLIF